MTSSRTPEDALAGGNDSPLAGLAVRAVVQESRAAATRGLLHDFGNVMVGLCSLSENAIEELPEEHPVHADLAIIRDSATRAHQILRRIVGMNRTDTGDVDFIDFEAWLHGEMETVRAVLPKGSELRLDLTGESLLMRIRENELRDALLVIAVSAARRHQGRIALTVSASRVEGGVRVVFVDEAADLGSAYSSSGEEEDTVGEAVRESFLQTFAQGSGGAFSAAPADRGGRQIVLALPLLR